jgi:hypothetical protein
MTKSGLKMKGGGDLGTGFWIITGITLLLAIIFMIIFGVYDSRANKVDKTTNPEKYDALKKKRYTFLIIGCSFFGVLWVLWGLLIISEAAERH